MKKICIIGTGYVGLVSGTCFAEMGNYVVCVDNNPAKLEKLRNNQITIYEPGLEVLFLRNINRNRLNFTDDLKSAVNSSEIIFLCLPTPQDEDGSADLSHVMKIASELAKILKGSLDYKLIVNKSTVPVGTGETVKNILLEAGIKNFDVASNPEFLREGLAVEDFLKPDRVVIGSDSSRALDLLYNLYEPFVRNGNPIIQMDIRSAELTKYAANGFLATKITFMNDISLLCEKTGANIDFIRKGMGSDVRIGNKFLYAGIGYGGSCFPKDVNALIKTAADNNAELEILTSVDRVNKKQRTRFLDRILTLYKNDIRGKHFAVWGLAFKPNTDDMREAPSVTVIRYLLDMGATVAAYDPVAFENASFYFGNSINYIDDMYTVLQGANSLIIFTEWGEFRKPDFDFIGKSLSDRVIFDGRNLFELSDITKTNLTYYSIGRQVVKGEA